MSLPVYLLWMNLYFPSSGLFFFEKSNPTSPRTHSCINPCPSMDEVYKAKRITTVNPTSGSVKGNSKYYKDIAAQALKIDNAHTKEAVQYRYDLESMVEAKFLGNPKRQRAYKSFVELYLDFGHNSANAKNYTKSLDLTTGIVTVEYDINGTHHKRSHSPMFSGCAAQ